MFSRLFFFSAPVAELSASSVLDRSGDPPTLVKGGLLGEPRHLKLRFLGSWGTVAANRGNRKQTGLQTDKSLQTVANRTVQGREIGASNPTLVCYGLQRFAVTVVGLQAGLLTDCTVCVHGALF